MAISKRATKNFLKILNSKSFVDGVLAKEKLRKIDPFPLSALPYWLKLDTWTVGEGIYLLAGLDPHTVQKSDALEDRLDRFLDALPVNMNESFLLDPIEICSRDDFIGSDEYFEVYLEAYENKKAILQHYRNLVSTLTHTLSRSVGGLGKPAILGNGCGNSFLPIQFTEWAESINFSPIWLSWAKECGFLKSNRYELKSAEIESNSDLSRATNNADGEKPLATTERKTLLTVIAALCDYSAILHQERGAAGQIASMTVELGAEVTDDTIRKILKQIPDALRTRLK